MDANNVIKDFRKKAIEFQWMLIIDITVALNNTIDVCDAIIRLEKTVYQI